MGISSDGILAFGIDLGDDLPEEWRGDEDFDFDDFLCEKVGYPVWKSWMTEIEQTRGAFSFQACRLVGVKTRLPAVDMAVILYKDSMALRKYTYKLKPSRYQKERLFEVLRLNQQLYNAALQERIDCYSKTGRSLTYNDQQASLTQIRADLPEYKAIPVYITRMTLRRLHKAFENFFRRVKRGETPGFPRFRSLSRFRSFEMCAGSGWDFRFGEGGKHGCLSINGVGRIHARGQTKHTGRVKTSQVIHKHGDWYLSVTVECDPQTKGSGTKAAGFDWGVEYLGTLVNVDGTVTQIPNPRYHRNNKEALLPLAQAVSRKQRGSNRWKRACRRLTQAKAKMARQRQHDQHQLSHDIAKEYALFATEKLTISNMTRSARGTVEQPGKNVRQKAGLNREILDTAPASLLAKIRYKVESTGGEYIEIPTRQAKPSQRCPQCGTLRKKRLDERQHQCDCGCSMPRDAASAWVMLNWALFGVGNRPCVAATAAT